MRQDRSGIEGDANRHVGRRTVRVGNVQRIGARLLRRVDRNRRPVARSGVTLTMRWSSERVRGAVAPLTFTMRSCAGLSPTLSGETLSVGVGVGVVCATTADNRKRQHALAVGYVTAASLGGGAAGGSTDGIFAYLIFSGSSGSTSPRM